MFEDVLFLEKMGCDFSESGSAAADAIGNYRVRTHGETVPGKDGKKYFLEFSFWRNRKQARYTNKRTGERLKRPVSEIINPYGVYVDTEHTDAEGMTWRNIKLESKISAKNYDYSQDDILKIVNSISTKKYTKIIFADKEAIEAIPHITTISGTLEREIIEHLAEVKRIQADKNYLVYSFLDGNGNSFEYELYSQKITG